MALTQFHPDNLFAGSSDVIADACVLAGGQGVLNRGSVLGVIMFSAGNPTAKAGNTGNGTFSAVTLGPGVQYGAYKLVCSAAAAGAGTFQLFDPNGVRLADVAVGVAYVGELGFTITHGATDYVVGDTITITVSAPATLKYKLVNSANTDGSQLAYSVLATTLDTTAGDTAASHYLAGEFDQSKLIFGGNDTINTHRITLRKLGIIAKPSVQAF